MMAFSSARFFAYLARVLARFFSRSTIETFAISNFLLSSERKIESAKQGQALFFKEKSNCTACHAGANFTDEKYHNLGVGMDAEEPDLGRFAVTGEHRCAHLETR